MLNLILLQIFSFLFINTSEGQIVQCRYVANKGYSCNGFRPQIYYFYHLASRTCQPFTYLGCGGNANRFLTINDCNRVCKFNDVIRTNTPIGQGTSSNNGIGNGVKPIPFIPRNNTNTPIGNGTNINSNPIGTGATGVNSNNQSSQIGTGTNPGMSMSSRLSMNSELINDQPLIGGIRPIRPHKMPGPMSPLSTSTTMNPNDKETTTMKFINGYAQLCNPTFAVVIDRPTVCGVNDSCPIGYVCSGNYCCPTKQTVCNEKSDSGKEAANNELEHIGRYAYDSSLKQCIKFSYFGIDGNFNNFRTYNDCMQFCLSS